MVKHRLELFYRHVAGVEAERGSTQTEWQNKSNEGGKAANREEKQSKGRRRRRVVGGLSAEELCSRSETSS